jgi:peptidyl-prolyl cis-trans isomerase A (cyclophilin A)
MGIFMAGVSLRQLRIGVSSIVLVFVLATEANAGTIVRVSTSMGDYSIELLDDLTPLTVQNFLNYTRRGDYNGTYLHRVENNFVVQGGAYRFQLFVGPIDMAMDPPVVNEFAVSNTYGTVAMAKFSGDPDSATNQWFVNTADNSNSLDATNGGFTVFGKVLGSGMDVLEAIDDLPTINLGSKASNAPYFTLNYSNPLDFVYQNVEAVERFSEAYHIYEAASGLLITSVDVDSGTLVSLSLDTVASVTGLVIQADLFSVIPRRDAYEGIATFSSTDNRLRIPNLEVHFNGIVSVVNNVVFVLSDADNSRFTLESYDQ